MSDTKSAKKLGGHTPLRTLERGCVRRTSRSTAEREAALNRSNALLPLQRPSVRDGAATGASPTVALRAARAARRAVAQTFLSAGSGDFPVPSAILKTVLASTMNPRSTKTSAWTTMFWRRYQQRKEKERQQLMSALENLTLAITGLTAAVDSAVKPHATDAQVQAAADAIAAQTTRLNTANGIVPPAPAPVAT